MFAGFAYLIGFIVMVIVGLPIIYYGLPHYVRHRRYPSLTKTEHLILTLLTSLFGTIVCCGGWSLLSTNYWLSGGSDEFYRMPLKYPYEAITDQTPDFQCIGEWQSSCIFADVIAFGQTDKFLFGEKETRPRWFMIDYQNEAISYYSSQAELEQAAQELGIKQLPPFTPMMENIRHYWGWR